MSYRVAILPEAEDIIVRTADWWAQHRSAGQARQWFNGIYEAFDTLEHNPGRCPLARESSLFPIELRELHHGLGSKATHRIIFTVRSETVLILTVRHTAQADLQPGDLRFPSG